MSKITFVFRQSPHGTSSGREGLDALLAVSAFTEDIRVIFLEDGVSHLLQNQQPSLISGKDYISMFKLFELYDIEEVFVCQCSLERLGLEDADFIIDARRCHSGKISDMLRAGQKVLTF